MTYILTLNSEPKPDLNGMSRSERIDAMARWAHRMRMTCVSKLTLLRWTDPGMTWDDLGDMAPLMVVTSDHPRAMERLAELPGVTVDLNWTLTAGHQ